MTKYIVESWLKTVDEYVTLEKALIARKLREESKDRKDIRLFEVEETKKEI